MKKIKTSDLIGPALDWAVAKCEGVDSEGARLFHDEGAYNYSIDWSQGGPIIEREGMQLDCFPIEKCASKESITEQGVGNPFCGYGPTGLTAAMRCFIASRLGDEVEIPEELA